MKFEETVQSCFDGYPTLYTYRWQVLESLFCTYGEGGNGYKWKNGEYVSIGDDRDALYTPRLLEGEQATQPMEKHREILYQDYLDIFEKANMRHYVRQQLELAERYPELGASTLSFEERIWEEVDKHIERSSKIGFPTLNDTSGMFTAPDDIKPDWLAGIKETVELVLEHGYGDIKEMSDWKNEEYIKTTTALYNLARKLGVMS